MNDVVKEKQPKKAKDLNPTELVEWLEAKFAETGDDGFKYSAYALRENTRCALSGTNFIITGSRESLEYVQAQLIKAAGR